MDTFKKIIRFVLVSVASGVVIWALVKFIGGKDLSLWHAAGYGLGANVFVTGGSWLTDKMLGVYDQYKAGTSTTTIVAPVAPAAAASPPQGSPASGAPQVDAG